MALSLDYLGKYIIMMVAVLVAIGIVFTMKGQIMDFLSGAGPEDDNKAEIIKISKPNQQARVTKIADLIEQCYRGKKGSGIEDLTCYFISRESGSFDISKDQIKSSLSSELREEVSFSSSYYDRDSIIVSWDSVEGKIVVAKP